MSVKKDTSARLLFAVALAVVGFGWAGARMGSVAAQEASPAAEPCGAILASGTPVVGEGLQGESVFSPNSPEQTGDVGNPADYPFDLVFIDAMRLHLHASVAMGEIALVHAGRQEIRDLAAEMVMSQRAEIDQLLAWRDAWYPGADQTPANVTTGLADEGMMRSGTMGGMGQGTIALDFAQSVAGLCQPAGPFDLAFLQAMGPHLQGAVGMAQVALERAQHDELKTFADGILAMQGAAIAQMMAWENEWYPSGEGTPAA